MQKRFKSFLERNDLFKKNILLAFSAGSDSSCLLDLFLKYKDEYRINLHIAHVDHSWREESLQEAKEIESRMQKLNLKFHLKTILEKPKKNLENFYREKRYDFFQYLYKKYNMDALLLAHHKDDLAETVLKRFLEGANLFSYTSMEEVNIFENMIVLRPLITICKKDIEVYLKEHKIEFFQDRTNYDIKYLRAKMRKEIFPFLQKTFNKNVKDNLAMFSQYSKELDAYLDIKTKKVLASLKKSSSMLFLDSNCIEHRIELRYLIKKIFNQENIFFSRHSLEKIISWLLSKKTNATLNLKDLKIFVDRGYLFILKNDFLAIDNKQLKINALKEYDFKNFLISVKKVGSQSLNENSSWQCLFHKSLCIYMPEDELDKISIGYFNTDKKLKKIWQNKKIPAILRQLIPVIKSQEKVMYDFLSGKKNKLNNQKLIEVTIKLK
jgi:tRNA(Ile)-lysidine synthase